MLIDVALPLKPVERKSQFLRWDESFNKVWSLLGDRGPLPLGLRRIWPNSPLLLFDALIELRRIGLFPGK